MIIPFLILSILACGLKKPNQYDFSSNRKFSEIQIHAELISANDNFKNYFEGEAYLSNLSEAKLGDLLFQKRSGNTYRFFVKENKYRMYSWAEPKDKPVKYELDNSYPLGLIIGQSKDKLYYLNTANKGKDFCTFSFSSRDQKITTLNNFIVIGVSQLANQDEELACGVYNKSIGFYIIDSEGFVKKELKKIALPFSPNGDPSVFAGTFYVFGDKIFYLFDNKSGIYAFDSLGNFIQEIATVDSFSFKHKSNKDYSSKFDVLYPDLLLKNDTIFLRTKILSTADKYIVFDRYSLSKAAYLDSFKLNLPGIDFSKYTYPVWTYLNEKGDYQLIFGTRYTSGEFTAYAVKL